MAERLEKDLWRLEIPLVGNPLKTLNSYLITGGERNLLIDTGFRQDPCREAMERQLAGIGVDRDRLDLFMTHLHSDHTGLAQELVRPGCRAYISEVDGPELERGLEDRYWEALYHAYIQDGFSEEEVAWLWTRNPAQGAAPENRKIEGLTLLKDGDELRYGGHTLRCLLTPGHTPGHMCLWEREEGWFFTGDHILFHITPNICRWSRVPDSLGDYLVSLANVRDLPARRLFPAHRGIEGDLPGRVDELTRHHENRIYSALAIVREEPGLTAYEIAGKMRWSIRCRSWEEFPTTQKFFAVGEALAHLDYLEVRGRLSHCLEGGKNRYYSQRT